MFLSNSTKVVVSKQQVSSNISARVWNLIHEPHTFGALRAILLDEYDVDEARLEPDLHTLLTQLADKDLVEIQGFREHNRGCNKHEHTKSDKSERSRRAPAGGPAGRQETVPKAGIPA